MAVGDKVVEWQEKVTESGIEIVGGPTTTIRRGILLSSSVFPTQGPNGMGFVTILSVARLDDGRVVVVNSGDCVIRSWNDKDSQ